MAHYIQFSCSRDLLSDYNTASVETSIKLAFLLFMCNTVQTCHYVMELKVNKARQTHREAKWMPKKGNKAVGPSIAYIFLQILYFLVNLENTKYLLNY